MPVDDVYVLPASVAQRRFWLLDQLQPGNSALNMPLALRLQGELDVTALHDALDEVVARHETLRTTLAVDEGHPVQVIAQQLSLPLNKLDISDLPENQREAETQRLVVEEAHTAFDLSRGPLFRTKLIKIGPDEHVLLLTLHHIICDGWSNGVLVREISGLYDAFSQGLPSLLPDLPIQYGDFAIWQQEWLTSERFAEQLAYWKNQLGPQLPPIELPTDFPRSSSSSRSSVGDIDSLLLPRPLTRAIKAMSQRADVTPFMIYLAAFKVLLHRYSGQEEILVGSPTANRTQSETELLIGPFANTLMLKTSLVGDPTFKEFLGRIKDVCLGAFSNQAVPFEKLAEEIRPAPTRGGGALFQVLFVFQTAFMQPVELPKLSIKPIRSVSPGSIFELSLGVVERGEGTRLQLEYNTELFRPETIKRMLSDLQNILQSAMLDSTRAVSQLLPWSTPIRVRDGENNGTPAITVIKGSLTPTPSRDDRIEDALKAIWQEVLHVSSISVRDDFFEAGGHSLLAARLFDEISKRLGVNLPIATLLKAKTIEQLAVVIKQQKPIDEWQSLVPINTMGTKPPLFLVHAAGGNVLFYKDLADRLGADQPCFGLQARGLDGKQLAHARIEDMAELYIEEMKRVQPQGPYYVGGSSFGGLVAYEIGCQLRDRGEDVALVALFDTYAPGYPKPAPGRSRLSKEALQLLDRVQHHVDTLRILNKGQRWPYLKSKTVKAINVSRRTVWEVKKSIRRNMLRSLGRQLPEALLKTQNAIIVASRGYLPRPYDGPVTLFRATKQQRGIVVDKSLGWAEFAVGGLEIHEIPGSHGSIVVEPRVRLLVEMLEPCLGDSRAAVEVRS